MNKNHQLPVTAGWFAIEPLDEHGVHRIREISVHELGRGNM